MNKIILPFLLLVALWSCDVRQSPILHPTDLSAEDSSRFNLLSINGLPIIIDLAQYVPFRQSTAVEYLSSRGKLNFLGLGALIKFTPTTPFSKIDTLNFRVCPATESCFTTRFYVQNISKNDAPTLDKDFTCFKGAWDDFYFVPSGTLASFDVLQNDYICDGVIENNSLKIWELPKFGRVEPQPRGFLYRSLPGFQGLDTFIYQINSLKGIKTTHFAHVVIEVGDCKPIPFADTFKIAPKINRFTINVIQNDILCGYKPELTITQKPRYLMLQVINPREIVCFVQDGFRHSDEFEYSLTYSNINQLIDTQSVKVSIIREQ